MHNFSLYEMVAYLYTNRFSMKPYWIVSQLKKQKKWPDCLSIVPAMVSGRKTPPTYFLSSPAVTVTSQTGPGNGGALWEMTSRPLRAQTPPWSVQVRTQGYSTLSAARRRVYTCVFEEESEVDKRAKVGSDVINDQRCCVWVPSHPDSSGFN